MPFISTYGGDEPPFSVVVGQPTLPPEVQAVRAGFVGRRPDLGTWKYRTIAVVPAGTLPYHYVVPA